MSKWALALQDRALLSDPARLHGLLKCLFPFLPLSDQPSYFGLSAWWQRLGEKGVSMRGLYWMICSQSHRKSSWLTPAPTTYQCLLKDHPSPMSWLQRQVPHFQFLSLLWPLLGQCLEATPSSLYAHPNVYSKWPCSRGRAWKGGVFNLHGIKGRERPKSLPKQQSVPRRHTVKRKNTPLLSSANKFYWPHTEGLLARSKLWKLVHAS